MNPLRPLIAFGGDDDGGGGGGGDDGGGSSSSSSSSTKTNQDRINEIYAASDDPWGSNGAELNELVNDRSGTYSGGSTTTTTSSSNNDKPAPQSQAKKTPSPAPTPTVVKTGTTLKTGTVLNNDDDPVVFTPNDDGGYTGQNQSTLPAAEPETFGDAFAENRAAGNETFTYNGNLYTTELASEAPVVTTSITDTSSISGISNASGNLGVENDAGTTLTLANNGSFYITDPNGSKVYAGNDLDQARAKQEERNEIITSGNTGDGAGIASLGEDDVMSQPVVTSASQEYLDSLPDFSYDFTAADDDGYGSPLPGDNVVADASGYAGYTPEQFVAEAGPTAQDIVAAAPPAKYYDAFGNEFSTPDAAAESDRAAEAAAAAAIAKPQNPFVDDLLDALAGRDRISQMLLPESAPGYLANIPVGVATGAETAIRGAADLLDARPTTNMTLERMRDMGPMTAAEEEFMIRSAGEEGQRMRQEALGPRDQFFYDKTAGLTRAVDYMKDRYDETIDNYEGKENIYKNIKSYEDVAGFGPGQVDPALLDAMQSKQGIVDSLLFGQGPGSAVRMDGSGFDPSTATQKGIEAFGTTTPGLVTAMMGPLGMAAGTTYGFTQVKGELDKDTGAGIDAFYASGRLQQSPAFKSLVDNGVSEADAVQTLKQRARDESAAFAGVLGGGATALEAGLLRTGAPGMLATPVIEALQEGPGESLASNQILGSVLGFDTPLSRAEILENMTAGGLGGGGASAVAPIAGGSTQAAPVLDPSQSPTAGQPAQSTVQTSYDGAQLGDGTDPMATSMEAMAAQQIIEDQVSQFGAVDRSVLNRLQQSTGLSMEELGAMEAEATSTRLTPDQIAAIESAPVGDIMTTAPVSPNLADEVTGIGGGSNISVRPNPDGTITLTNPSGLQTVVESGQSLDEAIQVFDEITTPIDAQTEALKLQAQEEAAAMSGARDVTSTPFTSVRREGISSLPAAPEVDQAPASGIETVVAKSPDDIIAEQRAAAPVKTFTTAKGSTYDAFGDGTTVRNRAERTKFGRPDGEVSGVQPRSQQTVFMTKEAANEIGPLFQNTQIPTELVIDGDKAKLVHKEDYGPKKAGSDASATVTLSTEPEVGLQPVEIMDTSNDNGRNIHFGNEITEVSTVDADQAITNKMDADNAAPAVEEDVAAVVEVAKGPDAVIAEQRQKSLIADLAISGNLTNESAEQLASQLGVDVITALDLVEEAAESMTSGEIDAAAVAAAEKAGSEAYDNFKPTTTLGKTTGILSAKDEAAREAAFNKAYEDAQAASRKDLFVGTGSDNADNAATEVKLPVAEETAAVVTEKADGSADVELSEGSTSKTVVEKDGDSKTTRKTGAAVTETETGATVELPADQTVAEQVPVDQDVFAADQVEQEAAATAAEQAAADAAAATETQTASTVAVSQVTDDGDEDEEVEVEVEDEVQEPGGDVTVDLDEDDTFVPVITSTDENGETITECPEGYTMVEGPDGPMCQKSVTATRQRAGAGTRAYTGLAGNIGRTGLGQRRKTTTSTERVRPTVRSA